MPGHARGMSKCEDMPSGSGGAGGISKCQDMLRGSGSARRCQGDQEVPEEPGSANRIRECQEMPRGSGSAKIIRKGQWDQEVLGDAKGISRNGLNNGACRSTLPYPPAESEARIMNSRRIRKWECMCKPRCRSCNHCCEMPWGSGSARTC